MRIPNVIPRLENEKILRLWRKAQESQWSANAIPWDAPKRLTEKANLDGLARVLSPILMSEQSAFHSAAALMPILGRDGETESQYYLTTWLVDEARHAELFSLMFRRLDRKPLSPRRFPHAFLFQSTIMSDDAAIWLSGVLVSELLAKHMMTEFRRLDLDPCLSKVADGILTDEARHIGFNRIYIEDRLASLVGENGAGDEDEASAFVDRLNERLAKVVGGVPDVVEPIRGDLAAIGCRIDDVVDAVRAEARTRMDQAIRAGLKGERSAASRFEQAAELGA